MANLRIDHLNKSYGTAHVLSEIGLSIEDGEFVVLVGPSGCGKSTLLRMIAGLDAPTSGDIFIGGKLVNALAPAERKIAMVFQFRFPFVLTLDQPPVKRVRRRPVLRVYVAQIAFHPDGPDAFQFEKKCLHCRLARVNRVQN